MSPEERKPKREKRPRQPMEEQEPLARIQNFLEVPFGYRPEIAQIEAHRCIECKKPKCVDGCPVEVNIPEFLNLVREGSYLQAAQVIKKSNSLPAVCGRVCPQEEQCEKRCVLGIKGESVGIGRLERFVADYERKYGNGAVAALPQATGRKVAIVGSGPAGLTCAGDLAKLGHEVHLFEALHRPGGVLIYGIPEFRLPKDIVSVEVKYLERLGVNLHLNFVIGKTLTVDELFQSGFHAVFVGSGAGAPNFMGIPGENLLGVYSSNEFLTRSNLMKAYLFPQYKTPIICGKNVAVIGAGNVAMDSARTALRLGAENVWIIYRRSKEEAPARVEEVHHAEQEGVKFEFLTLPTAYEGDDAGRVTKLSGIRMKLGEPDESGRRKPIPVPDSEFEMGVDTVIVAIGNSPNPLIPQTTPDISTSRKGTILVNEETMETTKKGVFAGGDIVSGAATVILAMGQGKRAARGIHQYLSV